MDAVEFGDFQTPLEFANEVMTFLKLRGVDFSHAIEPTCGKGAFLEALVSSFHHEFTLQGYELNPEHVRTARQRLASLSTSSTIEVSDFFQTDWVDRLRDLPEPLLIFGNPPWVTNSVQGSNGFSNLPEKSNFQGLRGFDAITGNSNFDISEWILIKLIEAARKKRASMAFLVKTSVARKILTYAHKSALPVREAAIVSIESKSVFNVSVDACLFLLSWGDGEPKAITAEVFSGFLDSNPRTIGFSGDRLIENPASIRLGHPLMTQPPQKWRSGLKHDCSKVMELKIEHGRLYNGFGKVVDIEDDYIFPLLKSSDIANGRIISKRAVIVTQKAVGEPTDSLELTAPKLWRYLQENKSYFAQRKSSIYKGKPDFAIFGVGDYSFLPFKIAISGLYKSVNFRLLVPQDGKPVQVDDTVYTISFETLVEAEEALEKLESEQYQEVLRASIFWDEKRPIKASILNGINWLPLAFEQVKG